MGSDEAPETLGAVLDDAHEVFRYEQGTRPQDRAHSYLYRRQVLRGLEPRDGTAMMAAAQDMCRRAHAVGVREGRAMSEPPAPAERGRPGGWRLLALLDGLTLLVALASLLLWAAAR